jgi:hypothetical protein
MAFLLTCLGWKSCLNSAQVAVEAECRLQPEEQAARLQEDLRAYRGDPAE